VDGGGERAVRRESGRFARAMRVPRVVECDGQALSQRPGQVRMRGKCAIRRVRGPSERRERTLSTVRGGWKVSARRKRREIKGGKRTLGSVRGLALGAEHGSQRRVSSLVALACIGGSQPAALGHWRRRLPRVLRPLPPSDRHDAARRRHEALAREGSGLASVAWVGLARAPQPRPRRSRMVLSGVRGGRDTDPQTTRMFARYVRTLWKQRLTMTT
jgi:hypothetical protein